MTAEGADRLNLEHIRAAAEYAAVALHLTGSVRLVLTPGDMTAYPIVIAAPGPEWRMDNRSGDHLDPHLIDREEYSVTLAASFGRSYLWMGEPVVAVYAADKWATPGPCQLHTGTVVAAFLNALAQEIEDHE